MNQTTLNDNSKKRLAFFLGMLFFTAVLILIYLAFTGNTNQKFTDIVIEYTAEDGSNKSAEKNLFYIFGILGALAYVAAFVFGKWGAVKDTIKSYTAKNYLMVALGVSIGVNLVIYKYVNWIVLFAFILFALILVKNQELVTEGIASIFIFAYAICGLYRLLIFVNKPIINVNELKIAIAAFVIAAVMLFISKDSKVYLRGILVAQLIVPFTLLVYLASYYEYQGNVFSIHIPTRVQLLIGLIIIAFIVEGIHLIKKNWAAPVSLNNILSYGTCVSILAFNRFSGTGSIISSDLHHPFENVIGYSQIFELGQKPFSEYIPVSGMYSILHGFVFAILGRGKAGFYNLSVNLYFLGIILVIVFLLRRQLKAEWVLLISLLFKVSDYNRIALIVPIILLLTWPKLIENKNLWLKAWFLSSFVHGLYYPLFGAAVALGFMPLAIWQIYRYAKSGDLSKDVKTAKFWGWWALCLVPVVASVGLLLGTLKHMLAMGSQTIYADGIARFGQLIAPEFLSYVSNEPVRLIAYYLFSYLILIAIIWLSVALFIKGGHIKSDNPNTYIALSMAIMLLVGFSFTVIRMDYNDIYSRSEGMVRAAFVVLIILIARFVKDNNRNELWIFGFSVFLLSAISGEGFNTIATDSKLAANYTIPDGYIYVNEEQPHFGECIVEAGTYEYIERINENMNTRWDRNQSYLGLVDSFGLYYLCDIKGDSVMEILNTIKGYGATEETVENILKNDTILGININPFRNYYLYHWLATSGEYIFSDELRLFIPNNGVYSKEEVQDINKFITINNEDLGVGLAAGSFGSSLDTLEPIFTEKEYEYSIQEKSQKATVTFDEAFDGDDADFIYLEFEGVSDNYNYILYDYHYPVVQDEAQYGIFKSLLKKNYNNGKTVVVSWTDDYGDTHQISCDLDEGKLLIPLGAGRGWLLNSHDEVTITVMQDENNIDVPKIKNIRMMKVREVK